MTLCLCASTPLKAVSQENYYLVLLLTKCLRKKLSWRASRIEPPLLTLTLTWRLFQWTSRRLNKRKAIVWQTVHVRGSLRRTTNSNAVANKSQVLVLKNSRKIESKHMKNFKNSKSKLLNSKKQKKSKSEVVD